MEIEGRLESVDQFLNIKLSEISVVDEEKYPHLVKIDLFIFFKFFYYLIFGVLVGGEELLCSWVGY